MHVPIRQLPQKFQNALRLLKIFGLQQLRVYQGKPLIHVIGDSHSLLFRHPLFKVHYIGPATAHNLASANSSNQTQAKTLAILDQLSRQGQTLVMFVLGEIDSRIHIYKTHKEKDISLDQAIEQTAQRYVAYLKQLAAKYPQLKLMIFNVLPPGEQGNYYNYQHYADRPTRLFITHKMNQKLKALAAQHQLPFIETFEEIVDENSNRIRELIFDDIHYNSQIVQPIIKNLRAKLRSEKFDI